VKRIAAVLLLASLAGCSGGGGLPGLGASCTLLCATGLTCSAAHVCVKSCRCDGGPLCSDTSVASGCPPSSLCVAQRATGEGACAVVCGDLGCPAGEAACATAPDGTPVCVGANYPWVLPDGGADGP
jgi:hypothetical protein